MWKGVKQEADYPLKKVIFGGPAGGSSLFQVPMDHVPLPPPGVKGIPTGCDYCIVGCNYMAYTWPLGQEGGPKANQNALNRDFPMESGKGGWPGPNQHTIVLINSKAHNCLVLPWMESQVLNVDGDHSPRGGRIAQKCYSPVKPTADRLKTPLLRVNGSLLPIAWDDAIRIMVELYRYSLDQYGDLACGCKSYSYQFWENTYAITKLFFRGFETPTFAAHDKPTWQGDATGLQDSGTDQFSGSYQDYFDAENIFISGTDPYETKTILWNEWIMGGDADGGRRDKLPKIIMVLPRKSRGCTFAEQAGGLFLQITPGTDPVLHNAMCRYIIEKGWEDKGFIKKHVELDVDHIENDMGRGTRNTPREWRTTRWGKTYDDWKKWLMKEETARMDVAERITGIPAAKIKKACELMAKPVGGQRPKTSLLLEKGNYWSNNYLSTISFANLGYLVGAAGRPGRVMMRGGGHQRGGRSGGGYPRTKSPEQRPGIRRLALDVDRWAMNGNIRVMWVIGNQWINQMTASQELAKSIGAQTIRSKHQVEAFSSIDDVIATLKRRIDNGGMALFNTDIYLREIGANFADLVLPAATWGEEDFVRAQAERRIKIYSKFYDPPGEAKPDWWIVAQVGKGMGFEGFEWKNSNEIFTEAAKFSRGSRTDYFPLLIKAQMDGKKAHELLREMSPTGIQGPITLDYKTGELHGTVRLHDFTRPVAFSDVANRPRTFWFKSNKKSGRFLMTKVDWNGLYADFHERIQPDPRKGELWVSNGRVNEIWQSLFDDMRNPYVMQRYPTNFVEINVKDARARGIKSGDMVLCWNDDVLVQEGGFWNVANIP